MNSLFFCILYKYMLIPFPQDTNFWKINAYNEGQIPLIAEHLRVDKFVSFIPVSIYI